MVFCIFFLFVYRFNLEKKKPIKLIILIKFFSIGLSNCRIKLTFVFDNKKVKIPKCASCFDAIMEQFVLKVEEHFFHMKCLKCADCDLKLTDKCYIRDGMVYCREDFFK